jgi:hypothetical protein
MSCVHIRLILSSYILSDHTLHIWRRDVWHIPSFTLLSAHPTSTRRTATGWLCSRRINNKLGAGGGGGVTGDAAIGILTRTTKGDCVYNNVVSNNPVSCLWRAGSDRVLAQAGISINQIKICSLAVFNFGRIKLHPSETPACWVRG